MTGRSEHLYQLGELASRTQYHPIFGAAIDFDEGKYGVGILTRETPLSTKSIPLPGEEPRVLLVVELQDYVMACTHLDLEEEQRLASVPIIVEEAQRWQKPFILAGDWNDTLDSELLQEMTKYISPSFQATRPPTPPTNLLNVLITLPYSKAAPLRCLDPVLSMSLRPLTIGRWWLG